MARRTVTVGRPECRGKIYPVGDDDSDSDEDVDRLGAPDGTDAMDVDVSVG